VQLLVEHSMVELSLFLGHFYLGLASFKELHQLDQELLSMGPNVHQVSVSYMFLDGLPVFSVETKSLKEEEVFFFSPPPCCLSSGLNIF